MGSLGANASPSLLFLRTSDADPAGKKTELMSTTGRASQAKRSRERANQERKEEKRAERARRKEIKKTQKAEGFGAGEDPDLHGITPGPQPFPH